MRNICRRTWKDITDAEYAAGLKRNDSEIIKSFFYGLCNYLLNDIKYSLMEGRIDYDELVNELYMYLSKDNWHRLDTFAGLNGCSLRSWVTRVAWRFFLKQRDRLLGRSCQDVEEYPLAATTDALDTEILMDVTSTFERMPNERYVQVLKWMLVEGYDAEEVAVKLTTTVSNVYNIKHRAIVQFIETYNAG